MQLWTRRQTLAFTPLALAAQNGSTPNEWREDLRFLGEEFERMHPAMKEKPRQKAFREALGKVDPAAPYGGLLRAFHALGDSHSGVALPALFGNHILPLGLYWFADGIYVAAAGGAALPALGKRITAIGGRKIDEVCKAAASLMPHENEWVLKHRMAQNLCFAGFLEAAGLSTVIDFEGGAVELSPVDMRGFAGFERVYDDRKKTPPLFRRNARLAYWKQPIEPKGTLYFQYNRCENEPGQPVGPFLDELQKEIASGGVERLIIDLRLNSGGSSSLLYPFIEFLGKSPLNRKGRLFGIIGRATYSSALMNAVQLTQSTSIIMAGEPTGGKPNHFGEVKQIMLPRTKLGVFCSTKYFRMLKEDPQTLEPRIRAEVKFADYLAGRDVFLEAVLKS